MKKVMKATLAFFLCSLVCFFVMPKNITANANSAAPYWEGTTASGEIFINDSGDCPLRVTSEKLTFDLQSFPQLFYDNNEDLLSYAGKVTAEYVFQNPTEYSVKAKMLFPFGEYPDYVHDYSENLNDTARYDVLVNGVAVEKTLRHTWSQTGVFDLETDLYQIKNGYTVHGFFTPDMPVYEYEFELTGFDATELASYESVAFRFLFDFDNTKTLISRPSGVYGLDMEKISDAVSMRLSSGVQNGRLVKVVFVGEDIPQPDCEAFGFTFGETVTKEPLSAGYFVKTKTQTTFVEWLANNYENADVNKTDLYNYVVEQIDYNSNSYYFDYTIPEHVMRWYEYEMEVPASGTAINAVVAPIYPRIDNLDGYNRLRAYDYRYLLSPAKTWESFDNLQIIVKTPYTLTKSNQDGFTETENGYELFFEKLPVGELDFTLRDPENMLLDEQVHKEWRAKQQKEFFLQVVLPYVFFAMVGLTVVGGVAFCIIRKIRRK